MEANLKLQFCPVKGFFQNGGRFEPEVELIWTKTVPIVSKSNGKLP